MKYTALYTESWTSGSHQHTITKYRRIEKHEGESIIDMLNREGIANNTVYLFHGHPKLQGE